MVDLMELAERVEALSGPNHEIDSLIGAAVGLKYRILRDGSGRGKGMEWLEDGHGVETWAPHAPRYTASLDAAMTLVPEGCGWLTGWGQTRPDEPMGGARITRNARFVGYRENYDEIAVGEAATPALALCAAALRARASNG